MKRFIISTIVFIALVTSMLFTDDVVWSAPNNGKNVYKASADYSTKQGDNNWYYQEWNGTTFTDLKWNESEKLWRGNGPFPFIETNLYHPSTNDIVRKWVAPKSGMVRISGIVKKSNTSCGDGVKVMIRKNNKIVWSTDLEYNDLTGVSADHVTHIAKGDSFYFMVNQKADAYCDGTFWDPTITYEEKKLMKYKASEGFSSIQGQNNWYYEEREGDKFFPLTWVKGEVLWRGLTEFSMIGHHWQHPDTRDTVRTWSAPTSGVVKITGRLGKNSAVCGNGVVATLYKNNYAVWSTPLLYNDQTGYQLEHDLTVRADDRLRFMVSQLDKDKDCDGTTWDPVITYLDPQLKLTYSSIAGFGSAQGQSNWYYQEGNGQTYTDMKFDPKEQAWKGSRPYSILTSTMYHPDPSEAVRKWVAPKSGTVRLTGRAFKDNIGCGNGIQAIIYKGKNRIWEPTLAFNDNKGVMLNVNTPVAEGESLHFVVNAIGADNGCDSTFWETEIEYVLSSKTSGYSYDAANRLESITLPNGQIINLYYDENGNLVRSEKG
ncbi:RHS repeat domain-containing protein [Paenibacillus sp. 481]|uniref:RHS repeat domain-containing protein n=1 Tax=Paenibacillus sp. 481 TaxID=2835869 RepID=UPI001E311954|nr:RHS repeat domain-containing protein [Paenibacillus sp. 481]UHA73731.1 RHS repeat protein [Paenibacillus sp. 481]